MPHDLSLERTVAAVAADRGHHFSKAPQDRIVLVGQPSRKMHLTLRCCGRSSRRCFVRQRLIGS